MSRARSVDEYIEMVKQAVFEVDDLRNCLEYYIDEIGHFPVFLESLESGIKALYATMQTGDYIFATGELPFMEMARKFAREIPFMELLEAINATHNKGLDIKEID